MIADVEEQREGAPPMAAGGATSLQIASGAGGAVEVAVLLRAARARRRELRRLGYAQSQVSPAAADLESRWGALHAAAHGAHFACAAALLGPRGCAVSRHAFLFPAAAAAVAEAEPRGGGERASDGCAQLLRIEVRIRNCCAWLAVLMYAVVLNLPTSWYRC